MTHDGQAVAVKVQYPGVDERHPGRPRQLRPARPGRVAWPFPGLDAGPLVDELRARMSEELDYRLEATNQQRFAEAYAGHPFIHVPTVLPGLSAPVGCSRAS